MFSSVLKTLLTEAETYLQHENEDALNVMTLLDARVKDFHRMTFDKQRKVHIVLEQEITKRKGAADAVIDQVNPNVRPGNLACN